MNYLQELLRQACAQLLQETTRLVEAIGGDATAGRIPGGLPPLKVIIDIEASRKNRQVVRSLTK